MLDVTWVSAFMTEPCPYPSGSDEEKSYYLTKLIPGVVFFTKMGVNMIFYCAYLASFGEIMFPFYKKATAIGICNLVARFCTIFSSLYAELDRPWPGIITLIFLTIAFIDAFFLPSIAEEEELERKINEFKQKDKKDV